MSRVRCPRLSCRSTKCVPVTENKKYKPGKGLLGATVGGALVGIPGAIVGAGIGLNGKKKIKFVCQDCGKVFEKEI